MQQKGKKVTTPTKTFLNRAISGHFFSSFSSFRTKILRKKLKATAGLELGSSDVRWARLPLDHHHGPTTSKTLGLNVSKLCIGTGCLDSRVVIALNFFWTLVRYALGREFAPRWWQTLYWLEYKICTQKEDAVEERRYNNDIMFISNG